MVIRIGVQFSCSFGGFRPWWAMIFVCLVSHKFSVGTLWHQSTSFSILVRILQSILGRALVQSISQYLLDQEPCSLPTLQLHVYTLINLGLLYCWPCIWKLDRSQSYRSLKTSRWRPWLIVVNTLWASSLTLECQSGWAIYHKASAVFSLCWV